MDKKRNIDKEFCSFQGDWQKQIQMFMRRGYKMHTTSDQPPPPGMTETLMFGVMWKTFQKFFEGLGPKAATLEEDFLKEMLTKILNNEGPGTFHDIGEKGEDNGQIDNKKPTIN